MRKDRLMIFADPQLAASGPLLRAFLDEARSRCDVEIAAVCECSRKAPPPAPLDRAIRALRRIAREVFDERRAAGPPANTERVHDIARRAGVPLIVPQSRNINHPGFIEQLRRRWKPTLAVSVGCLQIFRDELLRVFEVAVNYHDGYLPGYKGVRATAWSLYRGEEQTGYSFHRITAGIDAGPVLLQDLIPVPGGATALEIYRMKAHRAASDAGEVLNRMMSRHEGTPQRAPGSYFSAKDRSEICTIDDPSSLTAAEIHRRLRAFEVLDIRLRGPRFPVTAVQTGGPVRRLSFVTSDGVTLTPSRFMFLPMWLYGVYRVARGRGAHEGP
jgi:methionyl-tRNA formyltransferase